MFWIVAVALALVCGGGIALALLGRGRTEAALERFDLAIYRDQLAAVDRDLARGVVTPEEAERLRVEIKRRILEADRAAESGTATAAAPAALSGAVAVASVVVVAGGALWLYDAIGAPGYPDLPLERRIAEATARAAERPSQAEAEKEVPPTPAPEPSEEFAGLMEKLRAAVAERPDDLRGQQLLAQNEARLGRFAEAHAAQERVLAILGDEAQASDWADYADLLILAAGGYVSPEAEVALGQALARDPRNGTARYYTGLMQMQTGRPDLGFQTWERLLRESRPEAPWVPPIRAQIEEAAMRAGIEYRVPPMGAGGGGGAVPSGPGPTAADIEAAGEMSASDRMAMIESMVQGLNERLATEGGPPEDWARLIRAYGVLGRQEAAAAIWEEAQSVFEPSQLVPVLQAARDAGVAQ